MLYDRWRQIAREYRDEIALQYLGTAEFWTFGQLKEATERNFLTDKFVYPRGHDFILTVLRAWHAGRIVCPLEPDQPVPRFKKLPEAACVHLKTTSATGGGGARVVAFTEAQLAADAENIVATMGLRPEWPNLGVISIAHSYGFSNLVLPLLLHGIPLIMVDVPLPESVRKAAQLSKIITLAAVPALWRVWHEAGAIPENTRLAISAGAPLSLALEETIFKKHHLKIHNFYGSSECGGIAYDTSITPRKEANCAGAPLKNVQLSVGNDGCLEVHGPAVGQTYWPEPDASLHVGRFHTSDLAEIRNGLVYLHGRAGDQINVAGRKLSPEVIEKALGSHPSVRECLIFGAPSTDADRADTIVACVASDESLTREKLKDFLLERLPAWQIPREWIFVKSLEATKRGKISRAEWRRKYMSGKH